MFERRGHFGVNRIYDLANKEECLHIVLERKKAVFVSATLIIR